MSHLVEYGVEDVEGAVEVHALGPGQSLLVLLTVPVKHLQLHCHAVIFIVLPAAGGMKEELVIELAVKVRQKPLRKHL